MTSRLFVLICMAWPLVCRAQIIYSGGAYTQDFNSLDSGIIYKNYTNMPSGWVVSKGSYVWTTVTNGYSNNYGTYCFSLADDADKSIGLVIGSTGAAHLGARFRNATGSTLTSFSLSYFAEQWAKGAVTANDQVIPFSYSLDATNLTSGTFVNATNLDMHSTNDGSAVFAAMNGNAISNKQFVAATVSGISWLPNQDLWIRWSGVSHSFNSSHALAVDDLTFRAVPEIQISSSGSAQFWISWSTNYTGYVPQSASQPQPVAWDAVTNSIVVSNGNYRVLIDQTETQKFFRLKM